MDMPSIFDRAKTNPNPPGSAKQNKKKSPKMFTFFVKYDFNVVTLLL